jgi:hypothetical protein
MWRGIKCIYFVPSPPVVQSEVNSVMESAKDTPPVHKNMFG